MQYEGQLPSLIQYQIQETIENQVNSFIKKNSLVKITM